ncbi:MAG: NAD(+)/NADH kinase [Deltaproteobacteria bacterium]|nr:NAD(+)/NADH kinase [Deltaproteobacteria bacterium]
MTTPTIDNVLVISKRSAYDLYVRQYKMSRVRALLRKKDPSVARLIRADAQHGETLEEVRSALKTLKIKARFRDRSQIGDVTPFDLVITVGGDGTLLSVSHTLGETPVLGINSAPEDSVGFFAGARKGNVLDRLTQLLDGAMARTWLARMRVHVDKKEVDRRVLNEVLFAHKCPAMTSRYILKVGDREEEQKSSGFYIGPAAGSTAAIRSAGGRVLPLGSRALQLVVREPYTPDGRGVEIAHEVIKAGESIEVINKMREGCLFIDGPRKPQPVEIGQRVRFDLSPEPLLVYGMARAESVRKRRET